MADRRSIEGDAVGGKGPPPLPPLPCVAAPVFCARCTADITGLPPAARFCNRCGLPRPDRVHHAATAETVVPPEPVPVEVVIPPPAILLAYARALFNLGCRYETAVGSRRNLEEAARCYWKAARLGDAAAVCRFGPEALKVPVLSYGPPPLPPAPVQPPPLA